MCFVLEEFCVFFFCVFEIIFECVKKEKKIKINVKMSKKRLKLVINLKLCRCVV